MRRDRIIKLHVRERFVVTLKSGEAVEGVLMDADDTSLVMADCTVWRGDAKWRADGQMFLARADVAYMQRPDVRRP